MLNKRMNTEITSRDRMAARVAAQRLTRPMRARVEGADDVLADGRSGGTQLGAARSVASITAMRSGPHGIGMTIGTSTPCST